MARNPARILEVSRNWQLLGGGGGGRERCYLFVYLHVWMYDIEFK